MNWEYLHEDEFLPAIEESKGVCVIPIGCLEKHGQHLPVGTDAIKAKYICEKAAEQVPVVVFPPALWLGDVMGYHKYSPEDATERRMHGGIGLSPELLLNAYHEICDEIHRNGFRKILFVNSHGGNNAFLEFFCRSMAREKRDYAIFWTGVSFAEITPEKVLKRIESQRGQFPNITDEDIATLKRFEETGTGGGHADIRETGLIMAMDPKLVRETHYETESGLSTHRTDHLEKAGLHNTCITWSGNYPNMYNGFAPIGCTKAIGDVMMKIAIEKVAHTYRVLKDDEECVKIAQGQIC